MRAASGAYVVDLSGQNTWVGDREVGGAEPLHDGQVLRVGSARFTARVEHPSDRLPATVPHPQPHSHPTPVGPPLVAQVFDPNSDPAGAPPFALDVVPAQSQNALLAWMMGTIQGGQGEALRQQSEFQLTLTQLLRQIQQDNAKLLGADLARMESVDRELALLRAEIQRQAIEPPAAIPTPGIPAPVAAEAAPRPRPRSRRRPPPRCPPCGSTGRSLIRTRRRPRRGSWSGSATSKTRIVRPGKTSSAGSRPSPSGRPDAGRDSPGMVDAARARGRAEPRRRRARIHFLDHFWRQGVPVHPATNDTPGIHRAGAAPEDVRTPLAINRT